MDSCNSGSLQSSSGGEEEYDSRATFMTDSVINPNPLPPPTPFFDPFAANYLPLDSIFIPHTKTINNPSAAPPQPPPATVAPPRTEPRNPKKRTRASRRAPTTVLTTDATNFRAMVQEFTGIPSPPFARNSSLDLFPSPLHTPPYLSRPSAQKLQPPPFLPFLAGNNVDINTSSTADSQSSNIFSSIMDQGFLLQASHQKSNLFSLGPKAGDEDDGQVLHGSSFGVIIPPYHLNNVDATTFEGGLANLISSSSSTSKNDASHGDDKAFNYSSSSAGPLLASSLNGGKGQESSGRERLYGGGDIDA